MIRLLRFIIMGDWHLHEWEIWQMFDKGKPGYIATLRCKHCGNIKKVRT